MAIVAKAIIQDDYIIPTPFEFTTENIQGDELIIIAILDSSLNLEKSKILKKIHSFYGTENCKKLIGKTPSSKTEKIVICVSSDCVISHALNPQSITPSQDISPLWTEEKFGVSASEAQIMKENSHEILSSIHFKMKEYRNKLTDLKININKQSIQTIKSCEMIIVQSYEQLNKTKKDCKLFVAQSVAKFLRNNFPVEAWVDTLVDPAVFFCIKNKIKKDEATIIGCSIEGVFNEIEPENSFRFFNEFIYDASVFPIVMDVSFIDDKRITTKNEYYLYSSGGKS